MRISFKGIYNDPNHERKDEEGIKYRLVGTKWA